MLWPVLVFGGTIFWSIVGIFTLWCIIAYRDTFHKDYEKFPGLGIAVLVLGAAIAVFCEQTPELHWWYPVGYLGVGLVYFFVMFRFRLGKLKRFLTSFPEFKDGKGGVLEVAKDLTPERSDEMQDRAKEMVFSFPWSDKGSKKLSIPTEYQNIYQYEPNFSVFVDRLLGWPLCLLNMLLSEFLLDLYRYFAGWLLQYKKSLLQ